MELKFILESILFTAQKPLTVGELRDVLVRAAAEDAAAVAVKSTRESEIAEALETLAAEFAGNARSYRLVCVAGAWQFVTEPEYSPWIKALYGKKARPPRLSQPALETLAIIAYRQPLTRAEIEQIRGVSVDGVMQTLLERGLVEQTGRAEVPGRPNTYGTTALFLDHFGLRSLEDLPAADELRRIPVTRPEGLLTVPPGVLEDAPESVEARGSETGPEAEGGGGVPSGAGNSGEPSAPRVS